MSVQYRAVLWNRQKRIYDVAVAAGVLLYLCMFAAAGAVMFPTATVETLLIRHRHEISGLIAEVVAAWDADEISRKVEGEIGRDLQYIRINGTLVGAAAGVLLHGLSLAFSP